MLRQRNRAQGRSSSRSAGAAISLRRAVAEALEVRQLMADIGGGLVGNYYADSNFQNLAIARTDAAVDFNWGTGSPGAGLPSEGFSARWTGQITAPTDGAYTLTADSAGGVKVLVDGKPLIDDSAFHARHAVSADFTFAKGEYHDIEIDYVDSGDSTARLLWSGPGTPQQVVPQDNLFRLGTGWVSGGWISTGLGNTRSIAGGLASTGNNFTITAGTNAPVVGPSLRSLSSTPQSQFAYKTLRSDGEIVTRLDSFNAGSSADVIFRDSLDSSSAYVDLSVTTAGASLSYVAHAGDSVQTSAITKVTGPVFIKIKRDGNSYAGYISTTGADNTWKLVGTAGAFMDQFALVGFAVSGASTTNRAAFSQVRIASQPALGGNLQKIYDSSPERPFVDLLKLASSFQLLTGKPAPVDANGWPTVSDFQVLPAGNGNIASGRYTVTFHGPAGASVVAMRSATRVTKGSYDPATGLHIWYADEPANQVAIGFQFRNTGGTVKDIRILQPGYSPVNTPIYTDRYLNFLRRMNPASLRFMDWTLTNDVTTANWADRATAGSANWSKKGVAWEAAINLCNSIGSDLYINVPGRATDDYVRQLANLVRTTLRSDLNVYVEAGNEMWATNFINGPWNYQQALLEVQAAKSAGGESVLNYDHQPVNLTQTNFYTNGVPTWALRRTANRAKTYGDIFKAVWQQAGLTNPLNSRVRVMIAAQIANLSSYQIMFKFLNDVYGTPGNYIYAMAAAPYFTMGIYNDHFVNGHWTTLNSSATVDQLVGTMTLSSGAYTKSQKFTSFWAYGKPYGVQLAMYEGGHDTFGPFNIQAKKNATLDPRMKSMMKGYLSAFFQQGGSVFHYFTLGAKSYDTPYGTWPITQDILNTTSPKEQAFIEVRAGNLGNATPAAGVSA